MVAVKIFVEGGGDRKDLQARCREGFQKLLERVMPKGARPRIIACGARSAAFRDFERACDNPEPGVIYLLLVDAEEPVAENHGPWQHLKARTGDGWERPAGTLDESVHFMAVMTETWLIADPDALANYYGDKFKKSALPKTVDLEGVSKKDVMNALARATKETKKEAYEKRHGWELVGKVSPEAIRARCPRFGRRFLDHMAQLAAAS